MTILSTLVVKLVGDATDFDAMTAGAVKKVDELSGKLSAAGRGLTAGLTVPIVAAGAGAVYAASNLAESMNKVQVVFGDTAGSIVAFSETASSSMGMSQQAALEATGTFGNLFTAMGMGQEMSAEMSTGMVQLAADLASFNNIKPEEALEKLRAGLVGEAEPLRTLGVNLTDAAVKMEAMKMGLASTVGELTPAMMAQARYSLILQQTGTAQGDFARTSDSLANQMRAAKAGVTDVAAELGTILIPIVSQVVGWLQQALAWFQNLSPGMQKTIVIVAAVAAAVGPLLMVLGSLASAIGAILPVIGAVVGILGGPVTLIIGAVIALIALFALAWKNNWGGIRDIVAAAWDGIKYVWDCIVNGIQLIITWFRDNLMPVVQAVATFWATVFVAAFVAVRDAIQWVIDKIKAFIDKIKNIKLPSWLQRKSPSPFEMVWLGTNEALADMTRLYLPALTDQLDKINMPAVGGRNGGQVTQTFNQTIYTNAMVEPILSDFDRMRARARG